MHAHLFSTEADLATVRRLSVRSSLSKGVVHDLSSGKRTVWNQVAYEGEWLGHAAGEFEFTREVFEAIIRNFKRRSDPIPLTYGHPDGETASYMGAAGWIHALKIDTDDQGRVGLFAEMEFTDRAAAQVKSGEQRHCSVVVTFEGVDEKTGEPIGPELYEVGLVLSAFVDGMRPLAASKRNRTTSPARGGTTESKELAMSMIDILKDAAKELPEDATREQVLAFIDGAAKKQEAIEGDTPEETPEEPASDDDVTATNAPEADAVSASAVSEDTIEAADQPDAPVEAMEGEAPASPGIDAVVAEIVASGGTADAMAVEAWLTENAAEVARLFAGSPEDGTAADEMAAMSLKVETLTSALEKSHAECASLQKRLDDQRDAELSTLVDEAIECGAFKKERRATLLELGRSNRALFDDTLAAAKDVTAPEGVPTKRLHRAAKPGEGKRKARQSKSEQIAALSSREKHFYDAQIAMKKPHDEALEQAIAKARARAVAN